MAVNPVRGPPKTLWAYAYQIVPPQSESRLSTIRALLDAGQSASRQGPGTWQGRFVLEEQITHILVVSDSPNQDREVNRQIEAGLAEIHVPFSRTAPMALSDDDPELLPAITPPE